MQGVSLVAQMVKNLPAMRETRVWSLSQENPLEKGVATHSSILAWRTLWTEEPQATVHGVTKSQTGLSTHTNTQGKLGEVAWPERLTFRGPVRTRPQCSRQAVIKNQFCGYSDGWGQGLYWLFSGTEKINDIVTAKNSSLSILDLFLLF